MNELLKKESEEIIIEFIDNNNTVVNESSSSISELNPFSFNLSDFLPNEKPLTLDIFFELVGSVIKNAQKNIKESSQVSLVEEYPPEDFSNYGDEVISFKVIERKPGMMDKKGTSRPQRKSRYSYEYLDENQPNKIITVETRPVDHVIEFSCWAKNNKIANKRALWLEKLLINTAFVFIENGAERFHWKDRRADTYMTVGNQRIFYRPLHFFLRFREFDATAHSALRSFFIENNIINKKK
jgi:hypothetical protein